MHATVIVALAFVAHFSGAISIAANVLSAIDHSIGIVVDVRRWQALPPPPVVLVHKTKYHVKHKRGE
jgi:hypothetical protein